jgi:hypothetical protein
MPAGLDITTIDELTGGKLGLSDIACPTCGPIRRAAINQRRKVMRIWRLDQGFASFHCARCGERGYVRDGRLAPPAQAVIDRARNEAVERERVASTERLSKARWLWSRRLPLSGSIAETYLRTRGYDGPLPATLGFSALRRCVSPRSRMALCRARPSHRHKART